MGKSTTTTCTFRGGLKFGLLVATALSGVATATCAYAAAPEASDEVVVTAQKRSENIQNVPLSVTALSGKILRDQGITRIDQIATAVPNVQVQDFRGLGQPTFVIRGVALLDFNPNNTPAAGVYVDDIYQSSVAMGSGSLFDLERVEVLKGPQAGLYGRNTTGGAVQIISKQPQIGDESGYFDGSFGSYETLHVEGGQSIPISPNLAARVALSIDKGWDGWQTSLPSNTKWGAPDKKAFRISFLWKPDDKLTANFKFFYTRDDSQMALGTSLATYRPDGSLCSAVAVQGRQDQAGCLTYNQLTRPGAPSAAVQSDDGKTTLSQPVNQLHNRDVGGTLNVRYDLGFATISSITGYDHFIFGLKDDFAAAVDNELIQTERTPINYISEEVRLSSNSGPSDRLSWIVGANYALDNYTDNRNDDISGNTIEVNTLQTVFGGPGNLIYLNYHQRTQYDGFFGQAAYKLTDKLTLSAALRYSDEDKKYIDGNAGVPGFNIFADLNSSYKLSDHVTGKVSLQYEPVDDMMIYGSFSKGYKSGGFFGGFIVSADNEVPYKEEVVYAYETGIKTQWFDKRLTLNGAVFYYDHRNAQGYSTIPSPIYPGQTVYDLTNIGTEHHYGAEAEATLRPIKGLTIQASGARLESRVAGSGQIFYDLDGTVVPYQGRPVDYSPKWSGEFLVRYERDLTSGFRGGAQADYNVRTALTYPAKPADQALGNIPGYGILGGRVFVISPQGWTVALYATNLAGEVYKIAATHDGLGSYQEIFGQPRRIGIELSRAW